MKKFCSSCGNQLELSKRYCGECGDVNPFFVPAFLLLSDQSDALEKLRLEKEKIERELLAKEEKQAEFIKQELLRRDLEEEEKKKKESLVKEVLLQEATEREKAETELKKEIERLKEEAEQNKKETVSMLRVVRYELQQKIDVGNKQLKEEFELANRKNSQIPFPSTASVTEAKVKKQAITSSVLIPALFLVSFIGLALLYFYSGRGISSNSPMEITGKQSLNPTKTEPANVPISTVKDNSIAKVDSLPVGVKPLTGNNTPEKKDLVTPEAPKNNHSIPATSAVYHEPTASRTETSFHLTESKIRSDLVGKQISGCGVTINKIDEIEQIGNLVFVETLPSGSMKYKFTAKIVQKGESYNTVPYIYYTPKGGFIKVDGTNCE